MPSGWREHVYSYCLLALFGRTTADENLVRTINYLNLNTYPPWIRFLCIIYMESRVVMLSLLS
jgi:hypothetical protein